MRIKKEKLQTRIRRLVRRARERWKRLPEVKAIHEAVEEIIEAPPSPTGAPSAEQTILMNALNLRTRDVGDCMIPRADIKAVDINCQFDELISLLGSSLHSRIPIYRDTLDDVLGMIHIKDVMLCLVEKRECVIRDLLRPILIVAPSMPASKLLLQMRQTRQHMAVVVDEFGGVDGLLTIEDLVEEIVGEIEDEHDDPPTPDVIARADGTLLVDARMPISDFEDRINKQLLRPGERETIDTLGGYVFHVAGHVLKIGEIVKDRNGIEFEILEADQTSTKRMRVRGLKNLQESI